MANRINRGRGIYLLPNLFTTAALFAGFYAIVAASSQHFEAAAVAVFVAIVLDGLDGRIARLTHTESEFGAQYDSLSDMVSFGLSPALVVYEWSLAGMDKAGWLAAFIYAAAAALRLARFNTQVGSADKRYFQGLPSPAAAGLVAGLVWLGTRYDFSLFFVTQGFTLFLTVAAGILMVSNVRYNSFKELDLRGRVPFMTILIIVLVFVFISIEPPLVLFGLLLLYAVSGPVLTLTTLRQHRARRAGIADGDASAGTSGTDETGADGTHDAGADDETPAQRR